MIPLTMHQEPPKPEKPWIPPAALVAAQAAQGISWLLLVLFAWPAHPGLSMPALAWIHTVALGWLTMTALAVLVHVVPGFLDVDWVAEDWARRSLGVYGVGVTLLVLGFAMVWPWALAAGSSAIVLGLIGYMIPASLTILRHRPEPGAKAPLKRGFLVVLACLAVAAGIGLAMAWALAGAPWPQVLATLPPTHALLAGGGWLSMLIFGVSTRTIFPVTGRRRFTLPYHGWVSAGFSIGVAVLLAGQLPKMPMAWNLAGVALLGLAAVFYQIDMGRLIWKAPNDHKPPIAFVSSTLVYLLATVAIGWAVGAGHSEYQAALAFVALAGWMGQSVNGYIHHIGVRLLATMARGDEDETEPGELLVAPLSWGTFAGLQAGVISGTVLLLLGRGDLLWASGLCGLVGWACLALNIVGAWTRARSGAPDWTPSRPNP